jgi:hypothetical protein
MQNDILLKKRALALIEQLRHRIVDPGLCARHRKRPKDFSRECQLTFPSLMILLLQKSLKSLQARLHEFVRQLGRGDQSRGVTAGAVTHARAKLCASAFVELNRQAVLPTVYERETKELVRRWRGHRLLAADSSVVRLPKSSAVGKEYGWVECSCDEQSQQRYPQGRISVLYDLLNELALDARMAPWKSGEEELAHAHLEWVSPDDLIVTDRGYTSYLWLWDVVTRGAHFLSRCSRVSFGVAQNLFKQDRAGVSMVATLTVSKEQKAECVKRGWPLELKVRFVTVRLKTGELEVLVTSLLDESLYPTAEFAQVYWRRWGHETFYGRLKGRLDLENCSGSTLAAVEQDFAASVLLSNLESVLTGPAAAQLSHGNSERKNALKVNHAVSFHALKSQLIDLLTSTLPAEEVLNQLTQWFQANPTSVRRRRKVPRRKFSQARSYHYQRHVRKIVF